MFTVVDPMAEPMQVPRDTLYFITLNTSKAFRSQFGV